MSSRYKSIHFPPYLVSNPPTLPFQYLEENTHQTHVNVADMARALQDKYRDYNRRKSAPFRQLVEHAYQIVLKSYGLGSNTNSDIDDDEDQSDGSIELLVDGNETTSRPDRNLLGDAMNSLYTKKGQSAAPPSVNAPIPNNNNNNSRNAESAPIDISSEDDDDDDAPVINPSVPSNPILDVENNVTVPPTSAADLEQFILPNGLSVSTENKRQNHNSGSETIQQEQQQQQQVSKKRKINSNPAPSLALIRSMPTASGSKKTSASKKEFAAKTSTLSFADVGGVDKILKELCELLLHLKHPELYEHIGLTAPRGFLLHGPPGSGKTLLAQAIAGQLKVPLIEVAATELVAGISGESEERIREVFEKAASVAPCVLFIDEVDVISANRNNAQKDLERRIVSQLLSSLDGLGQMVNGNKVVVVGATNRADTLDPALRRVGRFDQEICLGIPDRQAREQILRIVCKTLLLEQPFSFDELAVLTPGYVGADLLALAMRAASIAVRRAFSMKDYEEKDRKEEEERKVEEKEVVVVTLEEKKKEDPVKVTADQDQMEVDEVITTSADKLPEHNLVPGAKSVEETTKGQENGRPTNAVEEIPVEKQNAEPTSSTSPPPSFSSMEVEVGVGEKPVEVPKIPRQHTLEEMLGWLNSDNESPLTKEDIETLRVTMADFKAALCVVQPSAKREGFITVPDVTWEDIGSLGDIRDELKLAILAPVKYPQRLEQLGLQSPSGVLLCGPPGCGKTLLAKAVANEAGINFISVKGPELLNMYVGESERAVRQCFQRAKNSAPCVIFFDEFDALCPKRSNRTENTSGARVVNQLLTEMDGVEDRRGVFLMAATNRPDMIDGAVLRPGRLDKILYVGLPEAVEREDILRALTKVSEGWGGDLRRQF